MAIIDPELFAFGANIISRLDQFAPAKDPDTSFYIWDSADLLASRAGVTRDAPPDIIAEQLRVKCYDDQDLDFSKLFLKEFQFAFFTLDLADKVKNESAQMEQPDVVAIRALGHLDLIRAALHFRGRQAVNVALAFEEALPFTWAFRRELKAIYHSRKELRKVSDQPPQAPEHAQLMGLAFSGGGIRSATFNLGIAQALAQLKLLPCFDYLSTVSGGGYIGSWLHAWIHNEDRLRAADGLSPRETPDPQSEASRPIRWLRQYSNYLAPQLGYFSADTWSIFTVWLRNTLLNQVVLILALAALLQLPRVVVEIFDFQSMVLAMVPLLASAFMIQQNLAAFDRDKHRGDRWFFRQEWIHLVVVLPIFLSGLGMTVVVCEKHESLWAIFGFFFGLLCFLSVFGSYRQGFAAGKRGTASFAASVVIYNALAAGVGAGFVYLARKLLQGPPWPAQEWHALIWGPPAFVVVYSAVIIVHIGLFGRNLQDFRREWWSRLGALLAIWSGCWAALNCLAIYGPLLILWSVKTVHYYWLSSGGLAWAATTAAGLYRGRSEKSDPKQQGTTSDWLAVIAPIVFIAGLLILLSTAVHLVTMRLLLDQFPDLTTATDMHFQFLSAVEPMFAFGAMLALALAAFLLAQRFDINEFSMNQFYENRLVRCYLGASRPQRNPNRFTGFDPDDDIRMADLNPMPGPDPYMGPYPIVNTALNLVSGDELAWQERMAESFFFTPLFSGFAVTPTEEKKTRAVPSNMTRYGFRPTEHYAYSERGGIRLGRAVSISGAAASPNMGYHSSSAMAFLLTVFNVRLGSWIGNPRHRKTWLRSSPAVGIGYLLKELAGSTNNRSSYVYLSDGGHFENLAIYELVRRGCRFIVVGDGGEDGSYTFEDVGNAIRKCRDDFGVEVKLDLDAVRPKPTTDGLKARSESHCTVGTIYYPDGRPGTIVYIKASMTGDEPSDILEYESMKAAFPHQPTSDQFFDESQFESYRRLGFHIAMTAFKKVVDKRVADAQAEVPGVRVNVPRLICADRDGFATDLRQRWHAPSPSTAEFFSRHAETLRELMDRLRKDDNLRYLDGELVPGWQSLMGKVEEAPNNAAIAPEDGYNMPPTYEERRAGFYLCSSLLQLMENVYLDLDLEKQWEHPDNAGWMNAFRHWSWSAMFRVTWMITASCYGSRFRRFCEFRLDLRPKARGGFNVVGPLMGPDDPKLNFLEQQVLKSKPEIHWDKHDIYQVTMFAGRTDRLGSAIADMPIGFAIVTKQRQLAYLRIQDHLRKMGLAQHAVDALIAGDSPVMTEQPDWISLPANFPEPTNIDDRQRVESMIRSAIGRKPRSMKASV